MSTRTIIAVVLVLMGLAAVGVALKYRTDQKATGAK